MTGNSGSLGVIVPMLHSGQVNHGAPFLVGISVTAVCPSDSLITDATVSTKDAAASAGLSDAPNKCSLRALETRPDDVHTVLVLLEGTQRADDLWLRSEHLTPAAPPCNIVGKSRLSYAAFSTDKNGSVPLLEFFNDCNGFLIGRAYFQLHGSVLLF